MVPESGWQELSARVRDLEARVRVLEQSASMERPGLEPAAVEADTAEPAAQEFQLGSALTLVGRSLLVLGGAFLLRAFTEGEFLSQGLGVGIGVLYALIWIFFSYRAQNKGDWAGASVHGLVAAVVGYPLLIETIVRFGLFSAWQGVLAICCFMSIGVAVAVWRRLRLVAWAFVLGGMAAGWFLLFPAHALLPSGAVLLAVGGITVWLSNVRAWHTMRWLAGFQIDALVLIVALLLVIPGTEATEVIALSAGSLRILSGALVAVYLGSFLLWAMVRRREMGVFEVVQALFVVGIGFGGMVATGHTSQAGPALAMVALLCAGVCYAVAFSFGDRTAVRRTNFYLYSWLALTFIILGSLAVAGGVWLTGALCGLAVASVSLGIRYRRHTLKHQGAVYLIAAAIQGGEAGTALRVFFGSAQAPWPGISVSFLLPVIAAAACYGILLAASRTKTLTWVQTMPRFVTGGWTVVGFGVLLVMALAGAVSADSARPGPAHLAVIRTAVLAVAAIALGLIGQRIRIRELAWLVVPLLVSGGLKLLLEDIRQGSPATLFLGFACYGTALIVVAHMVRKRSAPANKAPTHS